MRARGCKTNCALSNERSLNLLNRSALDNLKYSRRHIPSTNNIRGRFHCPHMVYVNDRIILPRTGWTIPSVISINRPILSWIPPFSFCNPCWALLMTDQWQWMMLAIVLHHNSSSFHSNRNQKMTNFKGQVTNNDARPCIDRGDISELIISTQPLLSRGAKGFDKKIARWRSPSQSTLIVFPARRLKAFHLELIITAKAVS